MSLEQIPPQAAHAGAAVSIASWAVGVLVSAQPVISAICGLLGIVSACYAIAWYRKRLNAEEPPP